MAGDGWISFAIMALAAVVANTLTSIAASNTNIPYIKNMLGAFVHFVGVQPPIPTADENILLELYLLSRVDGDASSARFSPAGVHHPPPGSSASAGGLNFLLVLYYLALAVLILYPLSYPFVRILVRKRAKTKADSEERDVARLLRKEKVANDGLTRENNELKQIFGQLQRNENQPEGANTWSPGSAKTVRNLIKENDSLRATLCSKENQTQATGTQLSEVEESKSNLKTELAKTKSALDKAETLNHKLEDDRNKEFAGLKRELQEAKNRSQNAENLKTTAVELLSKENTELKTELELATTKLQRAEESKSELGKNLTQANTGLKELETLTKENIDLKAKLERAKTKLQQAEKSKTELEKNLAQADTDLKELEPLTKENVDLKRKLEGATTKLQPAEKSKTELEKNLTQANTENVDLKRKLEGATTKLQRAEKSKTELEKNLTQANTENVDLKRKLEGATTKLQRAENSKTELEKNLTQANTDLKEIEPLTKENIDLKRKLEGATTTLQRAEKSKTELEKNLTQANTENVDLKRKLEGATTKLQRAEKSKTELEKNLTQANTDLKEIEPLTKENIDLKRKLEGATTKLQQAEKSKTELEKNLAQADTDLKEIEPLTKENIDLKRKLEGATTKLQRAEKSKTELEKNLTQANTDLKELEPLTKENIDLKRKLEGATTKLQPAEKSKTELEKKLTRANTDLDLETLTKENTDLKTKLEWSTDTLHLAEKSKSELKKNLNQANDGLREQLRKAKVMLNETEESKATELALRAKENVDLRNELQKLKNEREQQEADDAKRWKAVDFPAKEKTDLENELQQVGTTLQEAEILKSEAEASLNKVNTDLKTGLQKARAMLKEEEESKARAVDDMAKTNADLTNQLRRSEEEHKPRKTGLKSEPQGMEGEGKQGSNDVEVEIKNPKEKIADQDEQKKEPKMWDEGKDKLKRYNEDVTKRFKEVRPNQDDQESQGTIDTTEPHRGPFHDALALTPDASLSSGNVGPENPVALTPAKSGHSNPNISLQTLPANIQSAPTTPNNRADMPPTVGKLDSLDTKTSLPTASKPIASRDPLGLLMAKSSYASHDNTSKAPPIRNSTGSSVDPKKMNVEEAEKEMLRRSSYDTHSKLSPASSTGNVPNTNGETRSRTVAEPFFEGLNLNSLGQTGGYREDHRIPPVRIKKRNRGKTSYKPNKRQPDTATPSEPQRQDTRSWSKDERPSSVLEKKDPTKHSPNKPGKVEFNALNNPTIQTSYFSRVPIAPEHALDVEHITFIQTLSKQGLKIDEITAKTSEAFPLLYQNCGLMGARPTESSRESLISTAVGLHTMSYAKWYV